MKAHFIAFVLTLLTDWTNGKNSVGVPLCPDNFFADKSTRHCYGFIKQALTTRLSWIEANKNCMSQVKGKLAVVPAESQGAYEFIRDKAKQHGVSNAWMGAADPVKPNTFEWLDKTNFNPTAGILHPGGGFPKPHDFPTCIYFHFPAKSKGISVFNAPCHKDQHSYVCMLPMFTNDGPTKPQPNKPQPQPKAQPKAQPNSPPKPQAKPNAPNSPTAARKEVSQNTPSDALSISELARIMPKNLPGAAKIIPASAEKLVVARETTFIEIFGSGMYNDAEIAKLIPKDLYNANLSASEQIAVNGMLKEMVGEFQQKSKSTGDVIETGKSMLHTLLEEGRSIRCLYGVNEKMRKVECLGTDGVFKFCLRATANDGTIVRDCGLPGVHSLGCHETIQGSVCLCDKDLCNGSRKVISSLMVYVFQIMISIFVMNASAII